MLEGNKRMKANFIGVLGATLAAIAPAAAVAQESAMPGTFTGNIAIRL